MTKKNLSNFLILGGMVLGLCFGFANIGFVNKGAEVTSNLFLRLLQMISLPIIFLSITSTISGMKDPKEMKNLGKKVLIYTVGTTILAAVIGLLFFKVIDPLRGVTPLTNELASNLPEQGSYLTFFLNIVPSNLFAAAVENNVIGIAFVAVLISIATLFVPEKQKNFLHDLFSSLFTVTLKMTSLIITLIPLAVFAFAILLVKELRGNTSEFKTLFLYLACVAGANLVQGLIVLPALLKFRGISPIKSFRAMSPALTVAFFSKSSAATLPIAMRTIEQNGGVRQKISRFTLPLCSVINMNGCAAFILITTLFVSMYNGMVFSGWECVAWIFLATLAAIGNAGVPMGCFFLTSAFLVGMDIPLYMMGIILPFYTLLDMLETALNVWSDACITFCVDKDTAPALDPAAEEVALLNEG